MAAVTNDGTATRSDAGVKEEIGVLEIGDEDDDGRDDRDNRDDFSTDSFQSRLVVADVGDMRHRHGSSLGDNPRKYPSFMILAQSKHF